MEWAFITTKYSFEDSLVLFTDIFITRMFLLWTLAHFQIDKLLHGPDGVFANTSGYFQSSEKFCYSWYKFLDILLIHVL